MIFWEHIKSRSAIYIKIFLSSFIITLILFIVALSNHLKGIDSFQFIVDIVFNRDNVKSISSVLLLTLVEVFILYLFNLMEDNKFKLISASGSAVVFAIWIFKDEVIVKNSIDGYIVAISLALCLVLISKLVALRDSHELIDIQKKD